MPVEILIKILSYLDVAALFSLSHVNMFNVRLYFKTGADYDMDKWKKSLRIINPDTGLPSKTEQVLRYERGSQFSLPITLDLSWLKFSKTSVTLCWSGALPDLHNISALQLHGVRRIALSRTGLKPAQRSLMLTFHAATVPKSAQKHIGQDKLIELKLLQPGVVVGLWKDQCSVAFVMLCLHSHRLVESSTRGSSVCPFIEPASKPPFDDIDPEYGLHGYQLHITLHNMKREIMSESYDQLFCRKCNAHFANTIVSRQLVNRLSEHAPLSGSITFSWRCEALRGTNCCIMTLTLLDEFKIPLWYVSSAVCLEPDHSGHVDYNYEGDCFLIQFKDEVGRVKMHFVHDVQQETYTVTGLVIYITTSKINSHFGTNY
uniref:F-box domain-containing protein n=1 Tax=Periophthalmus magnuspinnatus TaxID=409849 RepID=A0A3B3ZPR7_9GOBI